MHSSVGDKSTCHLKKCVKYCKLESCRYKNPPPEFSEREYSVKYGYIRHNYHLSYYEGRYNYLISKRIVDFFTS